MKKQKELDDEVKTRNYKRLEDIGNLKILLIKVPGKLKACWGGNCERNYILKFSELRYMECPVPRAH